MIVLLERGAGDHLLEQLAATGTAREAAGGL
jgi:hypothetical protein